MCVEDKAQYIITVQTDDGRTLEYQTTRVISDSGADGITGRGTRVFEVRLKNPDGKPDAESLVLKDSWRNCNRDREDKILDKIFSDLGEGADEAEQYFLTVLEAGDVMVNGKIDDTVSLLRSSDLLADCTSYRLPADGMQKPKPTRSGEGLTPSFPCVPGPSNRSKVHHRIHFRLVFKEVCKPIYELQNLAAVFKILQDVHKSLQFLHSVGWVHRDISTGNILCAGAMGK